MARHILKPFTVETRSRRGKPAAAAAASSDPTLPAAADDQPRVSWPDLAGPPDLPVEPEPQANAPQPSVGRILPALDEPGLFEEPPEPPRQKRKPARTKPTAPVPAEPADEQAEHAPAAPAVDEASETVDLAPNARTMAATLLLRQGMKRLPRNQFKRGERWKARLPAAAHKQQR